MGNETNEKKKYTIRIQRTEYYYADVDVEAESAAAAIREVENRDENNEFDGQYVKYDEESHAYCTDETAI